MHAWVHVVRLNYSLFRIRWDLFALYIQPVLLWGWILLTTFIVGVQYHDKPFKTQHQKMFSYQVQICNISKCSLLKYLTNVTLRGRGWRKIREGSRFGNKRKQTTIFFSILEDERDHRKMHNKTVITNK